MKRFRKKLLSGVLLAAFATTLLPTVGFAGQQRYVDVPSNAWYADAVDFVTTEGMMKGTGAQIFSPNMMTSRGQLVTVLWNMAGNPTLSPLEYGYPFGDVDSEAYYEKGVYWARHNHIVKGRTPEYFCPEDPVTRQELVLILYKYSDEWEKWDVNGHATIDYFKDANKVASWAREAMQWAVAENIISGTPQGYLNPQAPASRAEVASVLKVMQTGLMASGAERLQALPGEYPKKFNFSSGAGGWHTAITLQADGRFEGVFRDYDLGVRGPSYPNGSCTFNEFSGKFGNIRQRDRLSYTMVLEDMHIVQKGNYIENGIRYTQALHPYGFDIVNNYKSCALSTAYCFYLPETPVYTINEEFKSWWPERFAYPGPPPSTLTHYGIENLRTHYGFFG